MPPVEQQVTQHTGTPVTDLGELRLRQPVPRDTIEYGDMEPWFAWVDDLVSQEIAARARSDRR
ncbi:hypothetical protein [Streptomyces sp. NPDC000410]|uniref:hypothetical protein n=1 Tax=Streptomyces sp. NPDC000410 TaxID=3154254 RepID=UPI003320CE5C